MIYLIEYYSISMIYSILVISYIYIIYIYHIYICHVCVYIYIQYVYCIILHTCMDSPRKNKKKLVQWVDRHGKNNVAMLYPTIPANHDLPSGNQTWHAQKI